MGAAVSSETSVPVCRTIRCNTAPENNFPSQCLEDLKSYFVLYL